MDSSLFQALHSSGELLYVGGRFQRLGGRVLSGLAVFNSSDGSWEAVGGGVSGGCVQVTTPENAPLLVLVGCLLDPGTQNPEPETRNTKTENRNPEPEARNLTLSSSYVKLSGPEPETIFFLCKAFKPKTRHYLIFM